MKTKIKIIINEQHSLLPEQESIIKGLLAKDAEAEAEYVKVPANGWTLQEMDNIMDKWWEDFHDTRCCYTFIFVSPIPYMIKKLTTLGYEYTFFSVLIFHNDKREKKELPGGKIIYTVAQTGWQLV